MDNSFKICDRDKIQIRDLFVKALGGIPVETLQRLVEQVMELPSWDSSSITDNAFKSALSTIVQEAAKEWAQQNKAVIHAAVLKALNARQANMLENLTNGMDAYLSELNLGLYISAKRVKAA